MGGATLQHVNYLPPTSDPCRLLDELKSIRYLLWNKKYVTVAIVDLEILSLKVMWDKSSACFNFIKAESIVYTSTKNYITKNLSSVLIS